MKAHRAPPTTRWRSRASRLTVLPALALATLAACAQILGLDQTETRQIACDDNADCVDPCNVTGCAEGNCLAVPLQNGSKPLFGASEEGCVESTCTDGNLETRFKPAGTACGASDMGSTLACTADGRCGGCSTDEECAFPDYVETEEGPAYCRAPSCGADGVCGMKPTTTEFALVDDIAEDCQRVRCSGEMTGTLEFDPNDGPVLTGGPDDACAGRCDPMAGMKVTPMDGEPCGQEIGICCAGVCDLMNECVIPSAVSVGGGA